MKSTKRFGARYGRSVKNKFEQIEAEQKKSHQCPNCRQFRVKRVAAGIWECNKCGNKFVNKAYTIAKTRVHDTKKSKILDVEQEE